MKLGLIHTALAVGLSAASPAFAAQTIYLTRSAFNAAAGAALQFESFEAQRNGQTVTYPGFTVSETNGSFNLIVHTSNNASFAAATTHSSNSIWYTDNAGSIATFTFAAPITAFGIDTSFSQAQTATFGGGVSGSLALAANTPEFFGVISDTPFSTVTVGVSGSPNVGFDALSFGVVATAVPEPASWAMMILGFGLIGGGLRARRHITSLQPTQAVHAVSSATAAAR